MTNRKGRRARKRRAKSRARWRRSWRAFLRAIKAEWVLTEWMTYDAADGWTKIHMNGGEGD